MAGFTVDEARRYLAASASRPLPPDLAEEMIRQSPAVDGPVPASGALPDRVSPFDLALYAAWADEDPDLDVAQVSAGSNAYIEGRIIERLDDPLVVRALPVLASAGRCRVTTAVAGAHRTRPGGARPAAGGAGVDRRRRRPADARRRQAGAGPQAAPVLRVRSASDSVRGRGTRRSRRRW